MRCRWVEGEQATMGIRQVIWLLTLGLIAAAALAACSDLGSDRDDTSATSEQDDNTVQLADQEADDAEAMEAASDDVEAVEDVNKSTVDVGVVLSLSGPNAAYGTPSHGGIELALDDLASNGDPDALNFTASVLDDQGDAATGADRFMEHIEEGVDVILGPTLSNTAFEAHPVAQENGVPVLAVSNTAEGITETGDYIFRVSLAEEAVVPQTVEAIAQAWRPQTAALIYSEDDAWSRSSAEVFRNAVAAHDIEIVTEQDVPSEGSDFNAQIESVAEANPDVILISALEQASITFVSQAREYGLEQNIACGNGCNTGTFIEGTGEASEGLVVGSAWHIDVDIEQSSAFVERYRAMHDRDPDQFSAQAYAAMQILAAAVGPDDAISRDSLRDALAALDTVETVLGPFAFDENRDGVHPAVIKIVQGDDFTIYGK
jgi:branched-chain amino acid transport system substrate-binding protein